MRKAQAAMEFLMTYGWAIMIVLVAIASLAYSGVLSPERFLPQRCTIPTSSGLFCEDLTGTTSRVTLRIRNVLPKNVWVDSIVIDNPNCSYMIEDTKIAADDITDFHLSCIGTLKPGDKVKGTITMKYSSRSSSGLLKTIRGDLVVKIAEEGTGFGEGFVIKNNAGENVVSFFSTGDITLKGSCSAGSCSYPGDDAFIIEDLLGETVAYVDSNGDLCIEDSDCNDNDASCDNPIDGSFIVKNSNDAIVSYIDSNGNLCLRGTLTENGSP